MFKLVLEKAEEPKIKLPTSAGSLKKQERGIYSRDLLWCDMVNAILSAWDTAVVA